MTLICVGAYFIRIFVRIPIKCYKKETLNEKILERTWPHLNAPVPRWRFSCRVRWAARLKLLLQCVQGKGRSSVCVLPKTNRKSMWKASTGVCADTCQLQNRKPVRIWKATELFEANTRSSASVPANPMKTCTDTGIPYKVWSSIMQQVVPYR
jgi:hypothetical protein